MKESARILTAAKVQASPFIKWPGGKRLLAPQICGFFPGSYNRYIEPFLGGGAVFFSTSPREAWLSDIDAELVNAYAQVKKNVEAVIETLAELEISKAAYYRMRALRPDIPLARAVRFLYLNRTAFNGIYRVNQQGEFNVPFGCKPGTKLCEPQLLKRASAALSASTLSTGDFESAFSQAKAGDLIYADPPYTTKHDDNGFRRYNRRLFSWEDQIRLASAAEDALARGVSVVVSNAHHQDVKRLYPSFRSATLVRSSCISGRIGSRGSVKEYLFFPD